MIANEGYNSNIPANGSVSFGGDGTLGSSADLPYNYQLHSNSGSYGDPNGDVDNDPNDDLNDDPSDDPNDEVNDDPNGDGGNDPGKAPDWDVEAEGDLIIDTSAFTLIEGEDQTYLVDSVIGAIGGKMTSAVDASSVRLTIKSVNLVLTDGLIAPEALSGGTINESIETISDTTSDTVSGNLSEAVPVTLSAVEWSYETPNLIPFAENIVTVSAVKTDGTEIEKRITLFTSAVNNFDDSGLDRSDTDGDRLINWREDAKGTDKAVADTDADGLSDYDEVERTYTDPLIFDTGTTGVGDGARDADQDGLSNREECAAGTHPYVPDSDRDGLTDQDELAGWMTDPLDADSDRDGLPDGAETEQDMDPHDPDSLDDGILDGDRSFTLRERSDDVGAADAVKPVLDITLSGDQIDSLSIEKVMDNDPFLNPEVPGYLGSAYDFTLDGSFQAATLSFEFDEALRSDPDFLPAIYYWNEAEQLLEELPNQTISGNMVSVELKHFSRYMLLNKRPFDDVWQHDIKPPIGVGERLDLAIVIDNSGSMDYDITPKNDPNQLRHVVAKDLINKLGTNDRACVVNFADRAVVQITFTNDKGMAQRAVSRFVNGGQTSLYDGIAAANREFINNSDDESKKVMVVLTDGEDFYSKATLAEVIQTAADNGIMIYTVGLGENHNVLGLKRLSEATGGKYFKASAATELLGIFDQIAEENIYTDTDRDELPDYFEQLINDGTLTLGNGVPLWEVAGASKLVWDAPNDQDSDDDGLKDGVEATLGYRPNDDGSYKVWVHLDSNPCVKDADSDQLVHSGNYPKCHRLRLTEGDLDRLQRNMTPTDMLFIANMIDQYKYLPFKPDADAVLAALYLVKHYTGNALKDQLIYAGFEELSGFGEVAYIEIAHDFARDGLLMSIVDDAYASRNQTEMEFLLMMVAYPLVDYLLYGPSFRPETAFASDSMLDQLEARGYLTPGQRQVLNGKWATGENIDDIIKNSGKLSNHQIINGSKMPSQSTPNSSADLLNSDGSVKQRRYFDEFGNAREDIDFNHTNDGTHTFPHRHLWDWTDPSKPRRY